MIGTDRSTLAALWVMSALASPPLLFAQQAQQGQPAKAPATTRPAQPPAPVQGQATVAQPAVIQDATRRGGRGLGPQGFSVVLVLGDLQGTSSADDVPLAARKALTDMREFLPYKSYRLLDAAWLMCCGEQHGDAASQILRGPDEQEYDLRLVTRSEGARVAVRFTLLSAGAAPTAAAGTAAANRTTARRMAELQDRMALLNAQIQETRKKVDVGVTAPIEVQKLETELRGVQRQIEDLAARSESGPRANARSAAAQAARAAVIDTNFSMDVGETVVVGTSRLKGGTKALIALLTAVPPRSGAR
jgi:hypothetical protein